MDKVVKSHFINLQKVSFGLVAASLRNLIPLYFLKSYPDLYISSPLSSCFCVLVVRCPQSEDGAREHQPSQGPLKPRSTPSLQSIA